MNFKKSFYYVLFAYLQYCELGHCKFVKFLWFLHLFILNVISEKSGDCDSVLSGSQCVKCVLYSEC